MPNLLTEQKKVLRTNPIALTQGAHCLQILPRSPATLEDVGVILRELDRIASRLKSQDQKVLGELLALQPYSRDREQHAQDRGNFTTGSIETEQLHIRMIK